MVTEYVDCVELKRLISDKKIKPSSMKYYLRNKGIVFTASNSEQFAEQVYTIFLGTKEMSEIKEMMINENNYEKSLVLNLSFVKQLIDEDIIENLIDGLNKYKSVKMENYEIEKPIRIEEGICVQLSYIRKVPGKNKLIETEKRLLKMNMRKFSDKEVVVDIRQQSSIDSKNAIGFVEKLINSDINLCVHHINLKALVTQYRIEFFDRIAAFKFDFCTLKNITSITVKQGIVNEEDEEETEETVTEGMYGDETLNGISQAVLNGSGLRTNDFVQKSLERGYYISAMRYRYEHKTENIEFSVVISFHKEDLRVDIDKSYLEEDGKIFVHPLSKTLQNEIIISFQNIAFQIYNDLLNAQSKSDKKDV